MENEPLNTAQRLEHAGKLSEAITTLQPHVTPPYTNYPATFALAQLLKDTERLSEAEALARSLLALATPLQATDLHRLLSRLYEARGHHRKAAREREHAAQWEEKIEDEATRVYARILRLNLESDYLSTYKAALEGIALVLKEPTLRYPNLCHIASVAAFNAGRFDDSQLWATKASGHAKASPEVRVGSLRIKSQIALSQGKARESLDRLEEATYFARAGASAHSAIQVALTLARTLFMQGRSTLALALAQETAALFSMGVTEANLLTVHIALEQGNLPQATEALAAAEASTRQKSTCTLARIALAEHLNDFAKAVPLYEEALRRLGEGHAAFRIRVGLAEALARQGKWAEAESERAKLLEPASGESQVALARLDGQWAYLKEDWSAGIEAWKRCLRLEPHAISLPEAWTRLGDGYNQLGEQEAARFAWRKAAQSTAETDWIRQANDRLELS